jgi:hypothetical protein
LLSEPIGHQGAGVSPPLYRSRQQLQMSWIRQPATEEAAGILLSQTFSWFSDISHAGRSRAGVWAWHVYDIPSLLSVPRRNGSAELPRDEPHGDLENLS